jgi:hypothetical protein
MTDDNLYSPYRGPKWEIGKLSIGFHSHEDILALAESFIETESFLDAVGYILKRVDVVFGLRPVSAEAIQTFLEPPPPKDQVSIITHKLTAVYLAWQIASDGNPAVAAFKVEMLENLRNEIHRVNRDAIDAVRNGTELQKFAAAYKSRKDITDAFYRMNRELGIHRAKYDLLHRVSDKGGFENDGIYTGPSVEDNSSQAKKADADTMPASPSIDEKADLDSAFQRDPTVSGRSEQVNPLIQWSAYRQPQEWRRLRKLKGLSCSVNIWAQQCRDNPADIQCESLQNARISLKLAQFWGLELPEFQK